MVLAQDSVYNNYTKKLDEVVITATKNEKNIDNITIPVHLISKSQIQKNGFLRLTDVLTEQTGLVVVPQVNGQGNGIQIQGMDPAYTLILVDGEPLIGRNTGGLELNRVTVGNIKQIEVIKGPSSSLYGSEALAGVINIITESPQNKQLHLYGRYGTNNTADITGQWGFTKKKHAFSLFSNYYSTNGYRLFADSLGKTVSPFFNYTITSKWNYQIARNIQFKLSARWFAEQQTFDYSVVSQNKNINSFGKGTINDVNINTTLFWNVTSLFKMTYRFYITRYETNTRLDTGNIQRTSFYEDAFSQYFIRPEVNAEYFFNKKHTTTIGAGNVSEIVQTSRYGAGENKSQQTSYIFIQHEWDPFVPWKLVFGLRYDHNSLYRGQLSPKISSQIQLHKKISIKASFGVGFKAPDFRQTYFNFNNMAAGYSILGTQVASEILQDLQSKGQISQFFYDIALLQDLKPEQSYAFNAGITLKPNQKISIDAHFFHNDLHNLIETQIIAYTKDAHPIYTYNNISKVYTQGIEINTQYSFFKNFQISAGYQLLIAKDKNVLQKIENKEIYYRIPETKAVAQLQTNDYWGLYNRSRHQGNIKMVYENKKTKTDVSLRFLFRGKYGIPPLQGNIAGRTIPTSDITGNGVLDNYDIFVKAYFLTNFSASQRINKYIKIQAGVENIFDYKDPLYIPNIPGRLYYISLFTDIF